MDQDNLKRNGIFAGAVVALLAVTAISSDELTRVERDRSYDDDHDSGREYSFRNSDDQVTEDRDVAAFTRIEVRGGIELKIQVGETQSLNVAADADHLEAVETTVEGDTLIIDMSDDRGKRFWRDSDVDVVITMPSLTVLDIKGAIDGEVSGLSGEDLLIDVKGAVDLNLDGTCATLTVDIKGAADLNARGLECASANVELRGAGDISVYASKSVNVALRGVGSIDVYGNPEDVVKRSGGIGSIDIH